jgi:hypothetical protein
MGRPCVAALFVATGGCYFGLKNVDPWDEQRDARLYAGPHSVVAHPPCERWGRWAGEHIGEDGGCFTAALHAVRVWGGVLEHPEASGAWRAFGLTPPLRSGGWIKADVHGGWTCCVEQGHYGHRARKATWLYAAGVKLPDLKWGPSEASIKPRPGRDPVRERRIGAVQRMSRKQRRATPIPFRDLLISIAATAVPACQHHGRARANPGRSFVAAY